LLERKRQKWRRRNCKMESVGEKRKRKGKVF
jgi:hypothetical protein